MADDDSNRSILIDTNFPYLLANHNFFTLDCLTPSFSHFSSEYFSPCVFMHVHAGVRARTLRKQDYVCALLVQREKKVTLLVFNEGK